MAMPFAGAEMSILIDLCATRHSGRNVRERTRLNPFESTLYVSLAATDVVLHPTSPKSTKRTQDVKHILIAGK
jgi:hypothetical protein